MAVAVVVAAVVAVMLAVMTAVVLPYKRKETHGRKKTSPQLGDIAKVSIF